MQRPRDMVSPSPSPHRSRELDREIEVIDARFEAMAARCRRQIALGLGAFWTGSKEAVAEVERQDTAVDEAEKSIDELLLRALALRQPVASDLRKLTASFKIVTDLERIGDEAVNIARGTAPTCAEAESIRTCLSRMGELAEPMVGSAVTSFLDKDRSLAQRVLDHNGMVDGLHDSVLRDSIDLVSRHPADVPSAMASIEVARCLKRIAEHAKNIAEGTLFVVGNDDEPMPL